MRIGAWAIAAAVAMGSAGVRAQEHAHGGMGADADAKANADAKAEAEAEAGAGAMHGHGMHGMHGSGSGGGKRHPARARAMSMGGFVMGAVSRERPAPMLMPIRAMMPGTWLRPGGLMVMGNLHAIATSPGFGDASDPALGRTHGYLLNDWIMARGRTESGVFEGLLMLNFEALSFGREGWIEVGQAGEGLWDRQHQHQLIHQALLAIHLTGASDGPFHATLWGGQGSASIGAPIFMHRASNPSPSVPRKHHKGENPHETFPVIGATLQWFQTFLDVSAFSARELGPDDSRLYPRVHAPNSFAARLRQQLGDGFEAQISGERLVDQGDEPDGWQYSASVYGRWVGRVVVDALLDGAVDLPDSGGEHVHGRAAGALLEVAVRSASLRDVGWTRLEVNDRIERDESVSKRWFFGSLGYERVFWVDPASVFGVGAFGEATLVRVPDSVVAQYGDTWGVTTTVGLRGQLMWMNARAHGR